MVPIPPGIMTFPEYPINCNVLLKRYSEYNTIFLPCQAENRFIIAALMDFVGAGIQT